VNQPADARGAPELPLAAGLAAAVANICFGAGAVAIRFAMRESDATAVAFLRYAIAIAFLGPFVLVLRRRNKIPFTVPDLAKALGLGLMLYGLLPVITNVALSMTTAWRATLIMAGAPMVTLLLSGIFRQERLTWRQLTGVGLALTGVLLAVLPKAFQQTATAGPETWRGDLLMLIVTCGLATYNILSRPLARRYTPLTLTGMGMAATAAAPGARSRSSGWSELPRGSS
jgi:drug/metabolite transporter (DMT)-like permease